ERRPERADLAVLARRERARGEDLEGVGEHARRRHRRREQSGAGQLEPVRPAPVAPERRRRLRAHVEDHAAGPAKRESPEGEALARGLAVWPATAHQDGLSFLVWPARTEVLTLDSKGKHNEGGGIVRNDCGANTAP